MKQLLSIALACILLGPTAAAQAQNDPSQDYTVIPERFHTCTTCHGVEFRGNQSVDAPRLNGMEAWYLRSQMRAFKNALRGTHPVDLIGMEMQPQAAALSAAEIDDAVALIASVPVRTATIEHTVTGDAGKGRDLYSSCAACHGPEGQGSKVLNAPKLAGQSDWYLIRQLQKYASGARGYDAADSAGQQMRAATAILTSKRDMTDVVAYINTLSAD